MSRRIGRHIRNNVIGYMALFVALSGSAYAGSKVGSNEIANNAVLSRHIHKGTIRSVDVKDNGLLPKDVRGLKTALADVSALKKAINALGPYVSSLEGRIAALENKSGTLQGTVDGLTGQVSGLTGQVNGLLGSLGTTDLSAIGQRLDAVCTQVGSLTTKVGNLRDTLNALAILLGTLNGITIPGFDTSVCHS